MTDVLSDHIKISEKIKKKMIALKKNLEQENSKIIGGIRKYLNGVI